MAAGVVVMPFLLSMLLGRTIDLTSYDIGANIYDDSNYTETPIQQVNSSYYVLEGDYVPYEYFGMPTDIVLRVKANYLSTSSGSLGLDGLLKDSSWMYNSAVVVVSGLYTTVQRSLSEDAKLVSGWTDRTPKSHTHYASSMTFGGWFFVLYRFRCDIPSDVKHVRKTVIDVLGTSGKMTDEAPALWAKVRQKVLANSAVRGMVNVETHVYSSVELPEEVDSPVRLVKTIKNLPNIIGKLGNPLYMTLKPLSEVDEEFPKVDKDEGKVRDLKAVDRMFDDLRNTRASVIRWFQQSDTIDEDQEDRISDLLGRITDCLRFFFQMIANVSLYKKGDADELMKAIATYKKGLENPDSTYYLEFLRLKEEIDASCEKHFLHGIRGLLKVYDKEQRYLGDVGDGGLNKCKMSCYKDTHCKAIGYGESIIELDNNSGNYIKKQNQCWIYHRSTSTATVYTPNGMSGDIYVYDRLCY